MYTPLPVEFTQVNVQALLIILTRFFPNSQQNVAFVAQNSNNNPDSKWKCVRCRRGLQSWVFQAFVGQVPRLTSRELKALFVASKRQWAAPSAIRNAVSLET